MRQAGLVVALGWIVGSTLFSFCPQAAAHDSTVFPTIGEVIRKDKRLDKIIPLDAKIEVVASGFVWSEGPLWVEDYLLFSDVPQNTIFKWKEGEGISVWMKPSGYTGLGDYSPEPGSNGLALDRQGRVIFCEHGDRRISVLTKDGGKLTLADRYQGKRFHSPNDVTVKSNGDIYFADPPYGLPGQEKSPLKEMDIYGVYRVSANGDVTLLTDEVSRPNGVAFSPDEKTLYVANTDPADAVLRAFPVQPDGTLGPSKVIYDFRPLVGKFKHLPDGLKVDREGNLFVAGPGGIHVLAPDGTPLGLIFTGQATTNCAFGGDGSELYMTADAFILRIKTLTKGANGKAGAQ